MIGSYIFWKLDFPRDFSHSNRSCQVTQEDDFGEVGGGWVDFTSVVDVDDED